jgi:hypothetical protein
MGEVYPTAEFFSRALPQRARLKILELTQQEEDEEDD